MHHEKCQMRLRACSSGLTLLLIRIVPHKQKEREQENDQHRLHILKNESEKIKQEMSKYIMKKE